MYRTLTLVFYIYSFFSHQLIFYLQNHFSLQPFLSHSASLCTG